MTETAAFYNTVGAGRGELAHLQKNANGQKELIMEFFKNHPIETFTPFQVMYAVFPGGSTPITSVRRAMTNLTKDGILEKLLQTETGRYGVRNHKWRYRDQRRRQERLPL